MAVAMDNAASAINTASSNDSGLDEAMSAEGANARRCTRHGANAVAELHTDKQKLGRRDGAQRIEYKPLPRKYVESIDRPAETYSMRAHQHGAQNCKRSYGNARKAQTVEQKTVMATCFCEAFIRKSKPWGSNCAYRNRSCCMLAASAWDGL